jgi:serine/threonine-protein kinase
MIGKTVSHYKILEKLGEGGMGVVYKAEDTKLKREVALKFLPMNALQTSDEKDRFMREAQAAASFSHANTAHIYAIEEFDDQMFIVMEFIIGKSIEDMLVGRNGRSPLRLEDAINYASQIAAGLQAAQEKGITHRDIKSTNIMVTDKDVVKIMDFGLAKLANRSKMTMQGTTLGTTAYMSPEQARGKDVDHRSDIWSLGVVLYEMITGQLPFKGDYEQAVIYAILNEEPEPLTALRSGLPIALDGIIAKALAKDPTIRYQHVDELPADLKASQSSQITRTTTLPLSDVSRAQASFSGSGVSWRLVLPLVALIALAAFASAWFLKPKPAGTPQTVQRFILPSSHGEQFERDFAISSDGKHLAYIANDGESRRIFHRRMDEFQAEPLPGTEDAHRVFFSADGRWLGFVAQHKLKKISTTGGSPQVICDIFDWNFKGASWAFDDTIILGNEQPSGLVQVSTAGGSLRMITQVDEEKDEFYHLEPHILPGGKHVLFAMGNLAEAGRQNREPQIALLSLDTKKRWVLLDDGGRNPRYVPTGYILYLRSDVLMAVPFDLDNLEITGSALPVLEGISKSVVADDGSLFYTLSTTRNNKKLVWVDRKGLATPLLKQPGYKYQWPRLSPDGKRVAYGDGLVIWVYDIERGSRTRFTFDKNSGEHIWTPDGKRITFWSSMADGSTRLFWKAADGSDQPEPLTDDKVEPYAGSWSPDGQTLAFYGSRPGGQSDIWLQPLGGNAQAIISTQFIERLPIFSPDGRWLAYVSNESGQKEVYVQPYPVLDKRWLISNDGGNEPTWAGNGQELFYRNGYKMMAVAIQTDPEFRAGTPRVLFEAEYDLHEFDDQNYDVTPDGQRFVMIQSESTSETARIHLVVNWFEELQSKMKEGKP